MSQFPSNNPAPSAGPAGSSQLVLIAFGVAIVAVVLMNFYVEMRVDAQNEQQVTFFRFTGPLEAGKTIDMKNVEPFTIPVRYEDAFGTDAIRESEIKRGTPSDGIGYPLNVSVVSGEVLRSSQFVDSARRIGRNDPKNGERQIALSVESEDQPANLAPGDRIDLLGAIPQARDYKYEVIMEYVEVAAVGERRSESTDGNTRSSRYGSITINVKPEQIKQLLAIQDRLPDKQFRIALRPPRDPSTPYTGEEAVVNPKVLEMLRID